MTDTKTKKAIAIWPPKPATDTTEAVPYRVEDVEISGYEDMSAIVEGYIEAVNLYFGDRTERHNWATMFVNEQYRLGQFGPDDINYLAMDIAGLGGRPDLMIGPYAGILGPVFIIGYPDDVGETTAISPQVEAAVRRVIREAL